MKKCLAILLTWMLLLSLAWSVSAAEVTVGATESSGAITISGTMTNGGVWKEITVLMVEEGSELNSLSLDDIVYFYQTVPDGNGDYSVTFTVPAEQQNGTYDIYIGGVGVNQLAHTVYPTEEPTVEPTEAPTETPSAAPAATPEVDMGNAKPAVNGSNAFYYVMTITLNDGVASSFVVKHYPTEGDKESDAAVQTFSTSNISNATVKLISVLKDIPPEAENTSITTKATLSYTIGGNLGTVETSENTTLNTTKGY